MNKARLFFSKLRYGIEQDAPFVFSDHEVEDISLKWLKKLMIARFNLTSIKILNTEVNRFSANTLQIAQKACQKLASNAKQKNTDFLIVLKIVSKDKLGQIPNYRIYNPDGIADVFDTISQLKIEANSELWFCLSTIENTGLNCGGRLIISRNCLPEIIELVWYTSPRRIEEFGNTGFNYPFLRMQRDVGKISFCIETLYLPNQYNMQPYGLRKFSLEGEYIVKRVWQKENCINNLCATLFNAGASDISLEFRVDNGNIAFIDWDTGIELNIQHFTWDKELSNAHR